MNSLYTITRSCTRGQTPRFLPSVVWVVFVLAVGLVCGWSLVLAVRASTPCQWPAEWDTLRDISMAQTMLDGRYPEDPILLGETLWYNPLTGALIGLWSRLARVPLHRAAILMGPYVNLLTPLGIVVLLTLLFGRAAALAGLCVVLFAKDPQVPFWVNAAYSPWLLAPLYSLGLLFFLLATYHRALITRSFRLHVLAGLLLGLVFTAHTAPALVAGTTMLLTLLVELYLLWRRTLANNTEGDADSAPPSPTAQTKNTLWRLPCYFCVLLVIAFVVSLPYTWSILWNYRFQVHNPFPSLFAVDYVSLAQMPDRLREAVNWRNALALVGVGALVMRWRRDTAARLILCWTVAAAAFTVQHYLWQALLARGIVWTAFVPGHHAAIHLSAVRAVLFAVGTTTVGAAAGRGIVHAWGTITDLAAWASAKAQAEHIGAACAAVCAGLALYCANPLTTRVDFQPPDAALYHEYHEQGIPMYQWILEHTETDAVFLCEEEALGMTVVMPAARNLVAPMLLYCNPYVNPAPLFDAKRALLDVIEQGDSTAFCEQARQYPVLYLLTRADNTLLQHTQFDALFEKAHSAGGLVAWRARPCPEKNEAE